MVLTSANRPYQRRWWRVAGLIVLMNGIACAEPPSPPPGPGIPPTQPAAPASRTVVGPGGRMLIAQGEPGQLEFKRIAGSDTEGMVVGSDRTFEIWRLPATFGAALGSNNNFTETCTATLIGPKVLLTAAHCVDRKDPEVRGRTYGGKVSKSDGTLLASISACEMATDYYESSDAITGSPRNEKDFALCELVTPINSITAETISQKPADVDSGQELMVVGYGCTEAELVNGEIVSGLKASGKLAVGMNTVSSGGPSGWLTLKGKIGAAQAILCPGDSGGGSFAHASLAPAPRDAGWRIVAINSAVGRTPGGGPGEYQSYLAPLSDKSFDSFLKAWMRARPSSRKVCGVNLSSASGNCRP